MGRALIVLGVVGIASVAALGTLAWFADPLAERAARYALDNAGPWQGDVGSVDVDLRRGVVVLRDLKLDAQRPFMVLRRVEAPAVYLSVSSRTSLATLHLDVHAPGLAVVASPPTPRDGDPPLRSPGWPFVEADLSVIDGRWTWVDGDFEHSVTDVFGTFTDFGTTDGNSHIDLRGLLPAGHFVGMEGWLDVLTKQGDALDLHFFSPHLTVDDLGDAAPHYLGVDVSSGTFALDLGVTVDPYLRSLPVQDRYHAGRVDNVADGAIRGFLGAKNVTVDDFELGPAEVDTAQILFQGSMAVDGARHGDVLAEGVRLPIRRTLFASAPTQTTPADLLALVGAIEPSSLHVHRFQPIWIDDTLDPVVSIEGPELFLDVQNLQTIDDDEPAQVRLLGDIAGGALEVDGTVDLTSWPMPSRIDAELRHLDVPQSLDALRGYTALTASEGRIDGTGGLTVDAQGNVGADLSIDGQTIVFEAGPWEVRTDSVQLDVFEGLGTVSGAELTPLGKSTLLEYAAAPETTLTWDVDRYLSSQVLFATATVDRPQVRALRPPAVTGGGGERPSAPFPFSFDLAVTNGTVDWTDPTTGQHLNLRDVTLDVDRLGTASSRAHWAVEARLERGGQLSAIADVDAFAGPGRTPDPFIHGELTGLELGTFDDLSRAYLGFGGLTGQAGAELTMDASTTELIVDGAQLALASAAGSMTAEQTHATLRIAEDGIPSITGSAENVDGALDLASIMAGSRGTTVIPTLPTLRVPFFDLRRGRLDLVHPVQTATLNDIDIRIRDLELGGTGERGSIWTGARLAGGTLIAAIELDEYVHRASLQLESIELANVNGLLLESAGFDVGAGRASGLFDATVHPFDGLHADVRLTLQDVDVFSTTDFNRGFSAGLRDLGVGAALAMTRRQGTSVLDLTVVADESGSRINPVGAVLQSVGRRLGWRADLAPMTASVSLAAPDQAEPDAEEAVASEDGTLSATKAPR